MAAKALGHAIQSLEQCMTELGKDVASGLVMRVYDNVATFHERIQHYRENEVVDYLNNLNKEVELYRGRMTSMIEAALSEEQFSTVVADLNDRGFTVSTSDKLFALSDPSREVGWVLLATN